MSVFYHFTAAFYGSVAISFPDVIQGGIQFFLFFFIYVMVIGRCRMRKFHIKKGELYRLCFVRQLCGADTQKAYRLLIPEGVEKVQGSPVKIVGRICGSIQLHLPGKCLKIMVFDLHTYRAGPFVSLAQTGSNAFGKRMQDGSSLLFCGQIL